MDAEPPLLVRLLLKPADWWASIIRLARTNTGGTSEQQFREGTPLDLLLGIAIVISCLLLYPVITYLSLLLISRVWKRKVPVSNE